MTKLRLFLGIIMYFLPTFPVLELKELDRYTGLLLARTIELESCSRHKASRKKFDCLFVF